MFNEIQNSNWADVLWVKLNIMTNTACKNECSLSAPGMQMLHNNSSVTQPLSKGKIMLVQKKLCWTEFILKTHGPQAKSFLKCLKVVLIFLFVFIAYIWLSWTFRRTERWGERLFLFSPGLHAANQPSHQKLSPCMTSMKETQVWRRQALRLVSEIQKHFQRSLNLGNRGFQFPATHLNNSQSYQNLDVK